MAGLPMKGAAHPGQRPPSVHDAVSVSRQPRASWLLGDVIQRITRDAVDRYVDTWRTFENVPDALNAGRLRVALDAASACTATAIALARVENDATD